MAEITETNGRIARHGLSPRASELPGSLGGWSGVLSVITCWRQRSRDRAALSRIEPRLLRDMGISPDDARDEAAKPFWRA